MAGRIPLFSTADEARKGRFDVNGTFVVVGDDGGILTSPDRVTWKKVIFSAAGGLSLPAFYHLTLIGFFLRVLYAFSEFGHEA